MNQKVHSLTPELKEALEKVPLVDYFRIREIVSTELDKRLMPLDEKINILKERLDKLENKD